MTDEIAKEQARAQIVYGEAPSSFMCKSTDGEGVSFAYAIKLKEEIGYYVWPKTSTSLQDMFRHFETGLSTEKIPEDWLRMYF